MIIKLKLFLFSILISVSSLSFADDDGKFFYSLLGSNPVRASIFGCVGTCPEGLIIPSTIDGYSVARIYQLAFINQQLKAAIISDSVLTIGDYAFKGNDLGSLYIGSNVTTIGADNFSRGQLTSITIPDSVTNLSANNFAFNQLTSVSFGSGLTRIEGSVFQDNQLTTITIPDSIVFIGGSAFGGNQLTSVSFGNGLERIDQFAFTNNKLTSITIPDSVTSIGETAFFDNPLEVLLFLGDRPAIEESYDYDFAIEPTGLIAYCQGNSGWPGIDIAGITPIADCDLDGVTDSDDAFPLNSLGSLTDTDGDGRPNDCDIECLAVGMAADSDDDGDGVADSSDAFPLDATETVDTDSDGIGNNADADDDGDGVSDTDDAFPLAPEASADTDNDGFPDQCVNGICPVDFIITHPVLEDGLVSPDWGSEIKGYDQEIGYGTCEPKGCPNLSWTYVDLESDPALKLVHSGLNMFAAIFFKSDETRDFGVYENGSLVVRVKYLSGSPSVFIAADCNFPCGSGFFEKKGAQDSWSILKFSTSELIESGLEVTNVTDISVKGWHQEESELLISDIYWEKITRIPEDSDDDGDGVVDFQDAFPLDATETLDTDSDGTGNNADTDDDNDGVPDSQEISDGTDPLDANSTDTDRDGVLDINDADDDGDGVVDSQDEFPLDGTETTDYDSDGVGDNADADDDNDGVPDVDDAFPLDASEQVDTDGDGTGDNSDAFPNNALYSVDSDSDGMPDAWETRYGLDPNDASDATSDQDNDGVTALDEFLAGTIPSGSLDIDGNEDYDALTDGLLLLRGMFGLDGSALVTGTIASDAIYTESVDIESRIATLGDLADIDGNGEIDALTDGLLTLRYLFGLQGDTLINGVVAGDATRKTAEEIEAYLATLMPAL